MSAALLGKRCDGGIQDGQTRIALSDEQNFGRLMETALPLVPPIVRRIKRRLPRNFEADELEDVAVSGLLAAARDYRALQDGNFRDYAVNRIVSPFLKSFAGRIPAKLVLLHQPLDFPWLRRSRPETPWLSVIPTSKH